MQEADLVKTKPFVIIVAADRDDQELSLKIIERSHPEITARILPDGDEEFFLLDGIENPEHLPTLIILDYHLSPLGVKPPSYF